MEQTLGGWLDWLADLHRTIEDPRHRWMAAKVEALAREARGFGASTPEDYESRRREHLAVTLGRTRSIHRNGYEQVP